MAARNKVRILTKLRSHGDDKPLSIDEFLDKLWERQKQQKEGKR